MTMKPVEYVYFRCTGHDASLECPYQAQLLRPIDPGNTAQGFEFQLDNFVCPEAEEQDDPECYESWVAEVQDD